MRTTVFAGVILCLFSGTANAVVYQVGPGRTYETLQDVADLLAPGDIVEVDGGHTYPGGVSFEQPGSTTEPITIRGIAVGGQRPILDGGTNTVAFLTTGSYTGPGADHYIFEGFEVTGGSSRCIYHQAHDLTIRDVVVRDCPAHGILGADGGSGDLTVEYTEVHHCGDGSQRHQLYVATDHVNRPGSTFRLQYSYIHDANGGNNVKSRAERNEIYYNWIEGAYYHELELIGCDGCPEDAAREDGDVVGNVLVKQATGAGNDIDFSVVRFGGDGTGQSWGRFRFVNNTVLCGTGSVFRLFDGLESLEAHNNVFFNPSGESPNLTRTVEAVWADGEIIVGTNNWVENGASNVPTDWTGTIMGDDPGFVDLATFNVQPVETSPLVNAGNPSTSSPAGHEIPNPLAVPLYMPPLHGPLAPSTASPRPATDTIDIGAYEYGAVVVTPDAGVSQPDSGVDPPDPDAGTAQPDSGVDPPDPSSDDSGCGCRTGQDQPVGWLLMALCGLWLLLRRRRR